MDHNPVRKKQDEYNEQMLSGESMYDYNVFVMMRYRDEDYYETIWYSIRSSLGKNGLNAHLAKAKAVKESLWDNVKHYMDSCRYGIAVFEDIDVREYNPNISIELGYMLGQKKRCLLLKEERMPELPLDICGHIYRTFDKSNIESSIESQIDRWIKDDLGIQYMSEISKIFSSKEGFYLKVQKALEMLYLEGGSMSSHDIERNLGYHAGDSMTQIHSILLHLISRKLIEYEEDVTTYGQYRIPQNIVKVLSSYIKK